MRFLQSFTLVIAMLTSCTVNNSRKTDYNDREQAKRTFFPNEIKPVSSKKCFEGAYYRKLVSSTDDWVGIEGVFVLPQLIFDENRKNAKKPMQYMDNPSVYFGGNMNEQETDIGLTWEVIKDEKGNVSKDRRAFRPFLRRNEYKDQQKAVFENAPARAEFYWYPGEEIKMSVQLITNKILRFKVEGAGKKFERDFECNGFVLGNKGEFKRVNAIDQVGNEGSPVKPTATQILNGIWKETSLYRNVNNTTVIVPFHSGRYTEMLCPSRSFFDVKHTESELARGAETLTISGSAQF